MVLRYVISGKEVLLMGRLGTVDLLVYLLSSFYIENITYSFYQTSYLNEEVNCIEVCYI
jgi:hypothetical protein